MTEFEKLVKMMDEASTPYERDDDTNWLGGEKIKRMKYPKKGVDEVCSIIYGYGTYGYPEGLLEIRGLLTDEEAKYGDDIVGHLTAEDVFSRIKADYEKRLEKTQMVDKSNFSQEQYRADLQCAFDCGKASVECEDAISSRRCL